MNISLIIISFIYINALHISLVQGKEHQKAVKAIHWLQDSLQLHL